MLAIAHKKVAMTKDRAYKLKRKEWSLSVPIKLSLQKKITLIQGS